MLDLDYSPYVWLLVLGEMLALWLFATMWKRRHRKGVRSFIALQSSLAFWILMDICTLLTPDMATKQFFSSLSYVGITGVPLAWLLFTLEYTGRATWITRRRLALLLIEPIAAVTLTFTNAYHQLWHTELRLVPHDGFSALQVTFGLGFWFHAVYSYALLLIGVVLLVGAYRRAASLYRSQIGYLLLGAVVPWLGNVLTILKIVDVPVDVTPLAFSVTGLAMALSVRRYRLLDILPVARARVVESMSDGVVVLDVANRIIDINPAALRLVSNIPHLQEVMGESAANLMTRLGVKDTTILNTASDHEVELALGGNGTRRYFTVKSSPLTTREDELAGRVLVIHEITELRRTAHQLEIARQQAEEANQLKSQFLANMSHELRTPLNAIIGYAQLQLAGMAGALPPTVLEYQERTLLNARDLLRMINDLLDVSKIEAGRMELVMQPIDLSALLHDIESANRVLAEEKALAFSLDLDPSLPPVLMTDPVRLKQIIVNLLSNAIKFTQEGSVILRTERGGDLIWRLVVSDTGIGIPDHLHEAIFDEFRQVEPGAINPYGGTGLGLAIVRRLVVLMGGTITLRSQLGQGSSFTVTLPLEHPPLAYKEPTSNAPDPT